ncbi:MAG: hypothetical protein AB7S26_37990 [Sandaracinaceae bacterium]
MIALTTLASLSATARADGPYEGTWREGPMSINVNVESWGSDCGPRPQSTTTTGGGTFRITQAGDQLTFQLRTQRTTRGCWSENRAVRRVSSSYQAGTWRVVCRTPEEDSRAETGTYTIQALGDDQLQFRDQSRYDWQLNASRCQATIVTTQSFTRVGGSGGNASNTPSEPPTPRCTPGAASRVVLRPASAEVAPGGQQCFTARVVDSAGCALGTRPTVRVAEGDGHLEGLCVTVGSGTGTVRVVATSGSMRDEATIAVRTLDMSDLIARRSESGSVGSGSPEDAETETAARLSASEREESVSLLLPAGVLALALLIVGAAVVLLRRRARARGTVRIGGLGDVAIDMPARRPLSQPPPGPAPETIPPPSEPGEEMICPTCRRGYPPGTASCPHDETALVRYRDFASGGANENVCPVCGDRFPATVRFCGKDGVALEPAS